MMRPFASMVADGTKTTEQRDSKPPDDKLNTPIYILSKGKVYAQVKIISYFKNGDWWDWNLELIKAYKPPVNYEHPQGAQKWVKSVTLK